MSRKVFVTGSTGFIGNAVAKRFVAGGYSVYGLVRSEEKSKELVKEEITPIIGDVEKVSTYESILEKVSIIIHCATGSTKSPVQDDTEFFKAVSKAASKSSTRKLVILTSGCLLYGGKIDSLNESYLNEETPLNSPAWVSWRSGIEKIVLESQDFDGTVARPGFLYGGSGSYTSYFFGNALAPKIEMKGNPNKKWSFIHYTDLAEGYFRMAEAPIYTVKGQIFNFADSTRATVKQIIEKAARIVGYKGEISFGPAENDFFGINCEQDCILDCSKAERLLGWRPRHFGFYEDLDKYYAAWLAHKK